MSSFIDSGAGIVLRIYMIHFSPSIEQRKHFIIVKQTNYVVLVKFYCDAITRSRLQLINTSIDTFFSKLYAFLAEQRRKGRPVMVKRKLDGTVDESLADQKFLKIRCDCT